MIMKVIRFIIAGFAALWTLGVIAGVIQNFGEHQGPRGTIVMFAGLAGILICLVITVWSFQWALQRDSSKNHQTEEQSDE